MKTQSRTAVDVFDIPRLKDRELAEVMEVATHQLVNVQPGKEGLIRFWGMVLMLLDEELRHRRLEVAELNRLYSR